MDAREKVTQYVRENVSPMLRAGEPKFDEAAGLWHVPVVSDTGKRAVVLGTYVLDAKLRFVRNPVKQIMDRFSDHLSGEAMGGSTDGGEGERGETQLGHVVSRPRPLAEHAEEISLADPLTGLGTAAAFIMRLDQELDRLKRYEIPFCVAFLDVEGLWDVNLSYSPLVADAFVAQVGKVVEAATRGSDFVAHWAGGRFALLLQGAKEEVLVGCERILAAVRAFQPVVNAGEKPLSVAAHMGGACCPPSAPDGPMTPPEIIVEARGMLMAAKAADDQRPVLA